MSTHLQKGTMVEKLVEETAKDDQHLRHLIHVCDGRIKEVFNMCRFYSSMCEISNLITIIYSSQLKDK